MNIEVNYTESPLGQIIRQLLNEIERIEKKYPLKELNSPEEISAINEIAQIKKLLLVIHESVLPEFDQQKKPGLWQLLGIIKNLFAFKHFFENTKQKKDQPISNRITFELLTSVTLILSQAPENLEQLVPFLNPEALTADFSSGMIATAIKAATGKNFSFKHVKNQDRPYVYQLEVYGNNPINREIDIGTPYTVSRPVALNKFLTEIEAYLNENASQPEILQENIRCEFLQKITTVESTAIQQIMTQYQEAERQEIRFDALAGKPLLNALDEEIKRCNALIAENETLQQSMLARKAIYQTSRLEDFFSADADFPAQIQGSAQFDSAFYAVQLPEKIVGFKSGTQSVEIIPIKEQLDQLIADNVDVLQKSKLVLQEKREVLLGQRKTAFKTCLAEFHATFAEQINQHQHQLKAYENQVGELSLFDEAHLITGEEAVDFEPALVAITAQLEQLQNLRQTVTGLANTMPNTDALPEWIQSNDGIAVKRDLTALNKPLSQANDLLIQKIELVEQQMQKKSQALLARIEKAKTEAAFRESMRSADPEKMKQSLRQYSDQLAKAKELLSQLNVQQEKIVAELAIQAAQLERLEHDKITTENTIAGLQVNNVALMSNLVEMIKKESIHLEDENVTAHSAIDAAEIAISDLMREQVALTTEKKLAQNCVEMLNLLKDIKQCIDDTDIHKSVIPFKAIEKLPAMQKMHLDFNGLLILLNLPLQLNQWRDYRAGQDSFFRTNQNKADFVSRHLSLMEAINEKELALKTLLQRNQENKGKDEEIANSIAQFTQLKDQLITGEEKRIGLESALLVIAPQYKSKVVLNEKLQHEHEEIAQAQQQLSKEHQQLAESTRVLTQIIKILAKLDVFKEQVAAFRANQECVFIQGQLVKLSTEILQRQNELDSDTTGLADSLRVIEDGALYQANLEALGQLLDSIKQDFKQAIAEKIKLKRDASILHAKEMFVALKTEFSQVIENEVLTDPSYIEKMQVLISRCKALNELMQTNDQEITALNSQFVADVAQRGEESSLQTDVNEFSALLAQGLEQRIADQNHAILTCYQTRNQRIVHLIGILRSSLSTNTSAQSHALQAIIQQLESYDLSKQQGGRHIAKAICQQVKKFEDVHVQATLNKITVAILDAERQLTHIHDGTKNSTENNDLMQQQAVTILAAQVDKNKSYVDSMQLFYDKIANIHNFAVELENEDKHANETLTQLALSLKSDVAHFVISHADEVPDQASYQEFKENFMARLHSEDDINIQRSMEWKAIVANVAIGLLTVGVALGIQLIYSKATTGQFQLFFAKKNAYKEMLTDTDNALDGRIVPGAG